MHLHWRMCWWYGCGIGMRSFITIKSWECFEVESINRAFLYKLLQLSKWREYKLAAAIFSLAIDRCGDWFIRWKYTGRHLLCRILFFYRFGLVYYIEGIFYSWRIEPRKRRIFSGRASRINTFTSSGRAKCMSSLIRKYTRCFKSLFFFLRRRPTTGKKHILTFKWNCHSVRQFLFCLILSLAHSHSVAPQVIYFFVVSFLKYALFCVLFCFVYFFISASDAPQINEMKSVLCKQQIKIWINKTQNEWIWVLEPATAHYNIHDAFHIKI